MRLADVMTTPVKTVVPEMEAQAAWDLMQLHRIHHLVVLRDGRIAGIVSSSDLGGAPGAGLRRDRSVADFMTTDVLTASPDTTLREAANLMRGRAIECLPVVEDDRLAGIITATELLEAVGRGAERPVAKGRRFTLAARARTPHAQTAAKISGGARRKG